MNIRTLILLCLVGVSLAAVAPERRENGEELIPELVPDEEDEYDYYDDVDPIDAVPVINETLPGFRTRITQKGFDYASEVALDVLMKELGKDNDQIPNVSGAMGPTKVTIKDIELDHVQRPFARVTPTTDYGLRWEVKGLTFNMTADYVARFNMGFFTLRKTGSVLVEVHDFIIVTDFMVGRDPSGRPHIYHTQCVADVDDIRLNFRGSWSNALNVGASVLKYQLRDVLESQVCSRAKEQVATTLQKELATLPTLVPIDKHFEIDFRLTRTPEFAEDYIGTHHKGDIHWRGELIDPPFEPTPIPDYPEHTEKMVYLYITDYLINSGLEAAYRHDLLRVDISADQLPADALDFFDPNCEAMMCLNTIFPSIADDYPRGKPDLTVRADSAPMVSVEGNNLNTRIVGRIDVSMIQDEEKHFVFSVELTATLDFSVAVVGNRLMFNITDMDHDAELKDSTVGNIFTGFLFETALGIAIEDMVLPLLENVGVEGIPLPSLQHLDFVNGEIIDHEADGVLIAGCDLQVKNLPDIVFVDA